MYEQARQSAAGMIAGGSMVPKIDYPTSAPVSPDKPRPPLVSEQVEGLMKRLDMLHHLLGDHDGALSVLDDRLAAVLMPLPPAPATAERDPRVGNGISSPSSAVALASTLMMLNERVEAALHRLQLATNRVHGMRDRVEL